MLNTQIVGVTVRLFSVWIATWGLRNLPAFWVFGVSDAPLSARIFSYTISFLMLLIAMLLWHFPLTVTKKLIPVAANTESTNLNLPQFRNVCTSLLGLWVLSSAVPNSGYAVVVLLARSSPLDGAAHASIARLTLDILIGIWLLFGARGLTKFTQLGEPGA
ncbi:MAG: hypothetical protein JWM78_2109 [Verrucomicrobiaceae bacterium]|nr:hypothetical protein [Verrucomicrobiaceae bacterium]